MIIAIINLRGRGCPKPAQTSPKPPKIGENLPGPKHNKDCQIDNPLGIEHGPRAAMNLQHSTLLLRLYGIERELPIFAAH